MLSGDKILIRYPNESFLQRCHTFVPGNEAYSEVFNKLFIFILFFYVVNVNRFDNLVIFDCKKQVISVISLYRIF